MSEDRQERLRAPAESRTDIAAARNSHAACGEVRALRSINK
jgi:hypothetical protein